MGKHFECKIGEGSFVWSRRSESIAQEEKLDGIYVLRTSEAAERLSAEDTVRSYKSLAEVERAFRCLKGIDLLVRPIRHRTEDRVPAHIFLCGLAYYVEWHLRRAWAPLLFEDEERWEQRQHRDPVLSAEPSPLSAAQEALAGDCRWSSRAQLRDLNSRVGQPRPSDLFAQTATGERENELNIPAGAGADACAGSGLRTGANVLSKSDY